MQFLSSDHQGLEWLPWFPLLKCRMIVCRSSHFYWGLGTSFPQSQPLVNNCQFGVSPVNYSHSSVYCFYLFFSIVKLADCVKDIFSSFLLSECIILHCLHAHIRCKGIEIVKQTGIITKGYWLALCSNWLSVTNGPGNYTNGAINQLQTSIGKTVKNWTPIFS